MSKPNAILATAARLFTRNGFKETAMEQFSSVVFVTTKTNFHLFNDEDPFLKDRTTGT